MHFSMKYEIKFLLWHQGITDTLESDLRYILSPMLTFEICSIDFSSQVKDWSLQLTVRLTSDDFSSLQLTAIISSFSDLKLKKAEMLSLQPPLKIGAHIWGANKVSTN